MEELVPKTARRRIELITTLTAFSARDTLKPYSWKRHSKKESTNHIICFVPILLIILVLQSNHFAGVQRLGRSLKMFSHPPSAISWRKRWREKFCSMWGPESWPSHLLLIQVLLGAGKAQFCLFHLYPPVTRKTRWLYILDESAPNLSAFPCFPVASLSSYHLICCLFETSKQR